MDEGEGEGEGDYGDEEEEGQYGRYGEMYLKQKNPYSIVKKKMRKKMFFRNKNTKK